MCGLIEEEEEEEEGLEREGWSPLIPTEVYKTVAFLMALNMPCPSIVTKDESRFSSGQSHFLSLRG